MLHNVEFLRKSHFSPAELSERFSQLRPWSICACVISSAEIKQGRRPRCPSHEDAMSSGSQPCGCRAPGCAVARCLCPWLLLRPTLVIRLPVRENCGQKSCWGPLPAPRARLLSAGRSRGPWVNSAVSAGVSPVAAGGGCLGLISPQGPAWLRGPRWRFQLKCCSPLSSLGTLVAAPP